MLEEATLIASLFNICYRCERRPFLVSKCSLSVSLVACLVSIIGFSPLSHSGASVIV